MKLRHGLAAASVFVLAVVAGVAAAATPIVGNTAVGKAIFQEPFPNGCAQCHTLRAANAYGNDGANLDKVKPSYATVVKFVTNGVKRTASHPGGMPTFGGAYGSLSKKQIEDVAAFVYKATHK
jgi:mono/diheme cytochrome c family protein